MLHKLCQTSTLNSFVTLEPVNTCSCAPSLLDNLKTLVMFMTSHQPCLKPTLSCISSFGNDGATCCLTRWMVHYIPCCICHAVKCMSCRCSSPPPSLCAAVQAHSRFDTCCNSKYMLAMHCGCLGKCRGVVGRHDQPASAIVCKGPGLVNQSA